MRDRSSVILIKDKHVALIQRIRDGVEYYVFPGGGMEECETPEQAAVREAWEELGVKVNIRECIAEVEYGGIQYFYLADILEGEFGTGAGEEYSGRHRDRGSYLPVWVEINKLLALDVRPREVALRLQTEYP